ncbi:MAG: phospholipase D-like domain-containing protein [Burkholderiales bacterium]|nr:phospholipase D-like domain-containing protein [Burkholderiales bacterium]
MGKYKIAMVLMMISKLILAQSLLFIEPQDGRDPIINAINSAQSEIDITMYEIYDTPIENALSNAANRGVSVNIIYSNNQNAYSIPSNTYVNHEQNFCASNKLIKCIASSNKFFVTHEKTMLIDNILAIIMSLNYVTYDDEEYFDNTRDFGVIDNSQSDVATLKNEFNTDWNNALNSTANFPVAVANTNVFFSPSAISNNNDSLITLNNLLQGATKTEDIYSEEFSNTGSLNTNQDIVTILNTLAQNGVKIRIISEDFVAKNLNSKIQILKVPKTSAMYYHAKAIIVDNQTAAIMSVNFTNTSIFSNREAGIIVSGDLANQIESQFNSDWQNLTDLASEKNTKTATTLYKISQSIDYLGTEFLL